MIHPPTHQYTFQPCLYMYVWARMYTIPYTAIQLFIEVVCAYYYAWIQEFHAWCSDWYIKWWRVFPHYTSSCSAWTDLWKDVPKDVLKPKNMNSPIPPFVYWYIKAGDHVAWGSRPLHLGGRGAAFHNLITFCYSGVVKHAYKQVLNGHCLSPVPPLVYRARPFLALVPARCISARKGLAR